MGSMTLYQLTGALKELEGLAEEALPDEAVRDTLEALKGDIEVKATSIVAYVRNQEALADAIDTAAKGMKERSARIRSRLEWLNHYVLENMRAAGISRIESPEFSIGIQKNPPCVVVDTEWLIPAEYMVVPEPPPVRPDKKRIAEAIKGGKDIPGCHLEQTERLKVKP